jgi:hypothetical protein
MARGILQSLENQKDALKAAILANEFIIETASTAVQSAYQAKPCLLF